MARYLGEEIGKLGFGLMRLPEMNGKTDVAQVNQMVDAFMEAGFTYFDTAYVYGDGESEQIAKQCVVDRYPRDSFQLATKLPLREITTKESMWDLFETSLNRTGAGYFDYYLLHALDDSILAKMDEVDAWGFGQSLKAKGLAKNFGFSFHDTAEVLDKILTAHPEVDFLQLQINYIDWESPSVQARLCYEVAVKHEVPVIIMEPVKGGSLQLLVPEAQDVFKAVHQDASMASWGIRYAMSMDYIITVLSGMSNFDQMQDNIASVKNMGILTEEECSAIDKVVEITNSVPTIPCTDCKYCVPNCPSSISIPVMLKALNQYNLYNNYDRELGRYEGATKEGGKASDCIECGVCEGYCPQHIKIIDTLKEVTAVFEK